MSYVINIPTGHLKDSTARLNQLEEMLIAIEFWPLSYQTLDEITCLIEKVQKEKANPFGLAYKLISTSVN